MRKPSGHVLTKLDQAGVKKSEKSCSESSLLTIYAGGPCFQSRDCLKCLAVPPSSILKTGKRTVDYDPAVSGLKYGKRI